MLYRLYRPQDFAALYAIEEVCFQPPQRFSRTYMRQLTRKRNAAVWIAERDTRMLGFGIVDWTAEPADPTAYIQTLEVLPEARGGGIGSELLSRLEFSASEGEVRAIWLHVDSENVGAIRLYANHGFELHGREQDYYGNNRPALVLFKLLETSRS